MHIVIRIFLLVICLQSLASEVSNSANDFKMNLSRFKTISADFVQIMYDKHSNIVEKSQGHVLLKKPGKVYWETSFPNEQIIVKNKESLWIYDVDLEQVTIQNVKSMKQFNVLSLLLDDGFVYNKYFKISSIQDAGLKKFIFTPIVENFDFNRLVIIFLGGKLSSLEIYDHFDSKININFTKLKYNTFVDEQKFSFKVIDGVDVIQQ